jgi:hypothetical protein
MASIPRKKSASKSAIQKAHRAASKIPDKNVYTIAELNGNQSRALSRFLKDDITAREIDAAHLKQGELWGAEIGHQYLHGGKQHNGTAKTYHAYASLNLLFKKLTEYSKHGLKSSRERAEFLNGIKIIKVGEPASGDITPFQARMSGGKQWLDAKQLEVKERKKRIRQDIRERERLERHEVESKKRLELEQVESKKRLAAINKKVDASKKKVAASKKRVAASNKKVAASKKKVAASNKQIAALKAQLKAANKALLKTKTKAKAKTKAKTKSNKKRKG